MSISDNMDVLQESRPAVSDQTTATVSIIIVSYMTRELLRACLQSILRGQVVRYRVIVVDNDSSDGSTEMVEKEFPSVRLIRNHDNLGFAKANNIAMAHAVGDYVLLLNPDTTLKPSTLDQLVAFMSSDSEVSAAGCKVYYPDGTVQPSCGHFPTILSAFWGGHAINTLFRKVFPNHKFPGACGIPTEALDSPHEVETLLGACVILRREVLEEVGLFDERMFMYFEECDLFHRIRRGGGKIMYIPDAEVVHHAGASIGSPRNAVEYYLNSQEYYLKKHYALRHLHVFRLAVMVAALVKSAVLSVIYPLLSSKLRKKIPWHWHTFLHYWNRLFRGKRNIEKQK
jgi:GT2 family glycosyltransferase